ncbi:unnamed protein product [Alternaria alternata]
MNTRRFQTSANSSKNPTSSPPLPRQQAENPSLPSFSLIKQLQTAKPAVRYTVYAGLGLMATVKTTFWFHVLRAKFFPRASRQEQDKADALLDRLRDAMRGYHSVWMANYADMNNMNIGYDDINDMPAFLGLAYAPSPDSMNPQASAFGGNGYDSSSSQNMMAHYRFEEPYAGVAFNSAADNDAYHGDQMIAPTATNDQVFQVEGHQEQ